jgi:hypothetical protein
MQVHLIGGRQKWMRRNLTQLATPCRRPRLSKYGHQFLPQPHQPSIGACRHSGGWNDARLYIYNSETLGEGLAMDISKTVALDLNLLKAIDYTAPSSQSSADVASSGRILDRSSGNAPHLLIARHFFMGSPALDCENKRS